MTAFSNIMAYGQAATSGADADRVTEYGVVARVTSELAAGARVAKTDFPRFAAALDRNRRLWTALAVDAASDRNPLPASLRAGIVSLAGYVHAATSSILMGKQTSVGPLIEINVAIMRGLKGQE